MRSRKEVEAEGLSGIQNYDHPLGHACRMLNRFWLIADPEDHGFTHHAINDGYWEPWITAWVWRELSDNHAFVDVGANVGYYSLLALSKGCPAWAFEPQPKLAKRIEASARLDNVSDHAFTVTAAAVGAEKGELELVVPLHHGMNASIAKPSHSPHGEQESYLVPVLPLDTVADWQKNRPLLVKVDAEGAEPLVWQGMQRLFTRPEPTTVLLEYRWDRYDNPLEFAQQLFANHRVAYVDYDSKEIPIDHPEQLAGRESEDWMLVIR